MLQTCNRNSITSPRDFFELVVTPDFDDYYKSQGDIRLAFHACMSLDHLADWIAKSLQQNRGRFLEVKYKQCAALRTIRHLSANAKHFPPTEAPVMSIKSSAATLKIDDFTILDDIPDWDTHGAGPQVIANVDNGDKIWLANSIASAYAFWKREYEGHKW